MALDLYQRVTDAIVQMIERGFDGEKLRPLWTTPSGHSPIPISAASKKAYRGINTVLLWAASIQFGYRSVHWATYRGWSQLGCQVRRGETATMIVFWKKLHARDAPDDTAEDSPEDTPGRPRMMARAYNVFNAAQVEGWTEPPPQEDIQKLPIEDRIDIADTFAKNTGAVIRHGGSQAYFVPSQDYVQMPEFEHFRDAESYYSVLLHELTHWTGHEHRLNRSFSKRFGDQAYAFEELVAEIGSAFVLASIGLSAEPREDHARYVGNWLKVLKGDKRAIFTAASQAQRAADLLWSLQPGGVEGGEVDEGEGEVEAA